MNYIFKEASLYKAANIVFYSAFAFLLLPFFPATAQDYYLEAQTIKSGEEVSYTAVDAIYSTSATEFTVESGGHATLKAGKRIELNVGFTVLNGGGLSATLESLAPVPGDGDSESVSVFPNPTDGIINVVASQQVNAVRLADINGFIVMEQTDINKTDFSIDITPLKPGFYILEIISEKTIEKVRIEKK